MSKLAEFLNREGNEYPDIMIRPVEGKTSMEILNDASQALYDFTKPDIEEGRKNLAEQIQATTTISELEKIEVPSVSSALILKCADFLDEKDEFNIVEKSFILNYFISGVVDANIPFVRYVMQQQATRLSEKSRIIKL